VVARDEQGRRRALHAWSRGTLTAFVDDGLRDRFGWHRSSSTTAGIVHDDDVKPSSRRPIVVTKDGVRPAPRLPPWSTAMPPFVYEVDVAGHARRRSPTSPTTYGVHSDDACRLER
jgi:hypothetical protein